MRKNSCFTRTLSVVLSIIMAFSCFGLLRGVVITAYAEGSATDAQWNALAAALAKDNVKNANYVTNGNNVFVDDPSGDVLTAAQAYYAVFDALVHKASSGGKQNNTNEYNLGYRTSQQIRDTAKNKMQSLMGGNYSTYNASAVLDKLGGPTVSGGQQDGGNGNLSIPSFSVEVTNYAGLTSFATLEEAVSVPTYKYSVAHRRDRYYETTSGSGCNATTTAHYYVVVSTNGTGTSSGTVQRDITALQEYKAELEKEANAAILNAPLSENINRTYDELAAVYTPVSEKRSAAIAAFGEPAVRHFFSSWETKVEDLNKALLICQYKSIVDEINDYVAADISRYSAENDLTQEDLDAISEAYTLFNNKYTAYLDINIQEVYNYFEVDNTILVRDTVEARLAEYETAYNVTYLKVTLYAKITAAVAEFSTYDTAWVVATGDAADRISLASSTLTGYITTLNTYDSATVDAVFGENYISNVISPLITAINDLIPYEERKTTFNEYYGVYTEVYRPVSPLYTDDDLYDVLNGRDAWYAELQEFVAAVREFDADFAELLFNTLEAAMEAKIDSVYAMLVGRVSDNINTAYDLYDNFVSRYGHEVTNADDITMDNYMELRAAFNRVSDSQYNFLIDSPYAALSDEVSQKYNEIRSAVIVFKTYQAELGYADHFLDTEEIADIIRAVSDLDVARNAEYDVTDENVEKIIDMIDSLLTSDTIKEKFDLGGTLTGVLDKLYTDDFLNTLIQYIYPMVAFEFAKVWADLPDHIDGVPTGNNMAPTANISLSLDNMPTALNKLGLYLLPHLLAKNVDAAVYPDVKNKLSAVPETVSAVKNGDEWEWRVNPWENMNIYDAETEKLTLEWGITDKESFLQAASVALSGVAPLLLALISNVSTTKTGNIGTGTGNSPDCSMVTITVTAINLSMTFTGNPGYNNMLAPILHVLGATDIPNGNDLTTIRAVLETGVIAPFEQILNKIADKPLDSILNILPSLAFALNLNLGQLLMNQLKTNIAYTASAHYTYKASVFASGSGDVDDAMADSIDINLGEMINLADMGIDITSFNGLLQSVIGLLTKSDDEEHPAPELSLPHVASGKLAMLHNGVIWTPGRRTASPFANVANHSTDLARLDANRADVFLFLLDWLVAGMELDQIDINAGKKDLLTQILDLVNYMSADEETETPGEGEAEEAALPELVQTILNNFVTNYTDSLAAVVELTAPQRYSMEAVQNIDWITDGNIGAPEDYITFWTEEYSEYTKTDWTREDAMYVEEHLEEALNNLIKFLSDTDTLGGAETLGEAIEYLAGSLITAETANNLVGTISGLLGGLELPEAIAQMGLLEQIGLDLTAWDDMIFDFENGDLDAFKAAITQILLPVQPLLGFLLAEQDIEITLFDALTVKALGYDGYSYGIVPLLEALGATGLKSSAEFIADNENIVKNIVDGLFSIIDQLIDNPMTFIKKVVPSIIYFDKVGGIKTVINNLLFAVNVLLDTIRPIYPLNLDTLITANADIELPSLEDDLIDFVMETVLGVLEDKLGIRLTMDYTVETLSETLHFTAPEEFESANGDTAYTITLSEVGQAELLVRILDYLIEQIAYEENKEKVTGMLDDMVGDNDAAKTILHTVIDNLINNYPDSVLAVFKLMYPRITDRMDAALRLLQSINWDTDAHHAAEGYWTVETPEHVDGITPWTQEKGEFMANHLPDVVSNVLAMVAEEGQEPADVVAGLLDKLFTAENANKIVELINGLLADLALPDIVKDLGALEQLGLDEANWAEMTFDFEDGDKDAFKAALIQIVEPLTPVLAFLLAEGDLEVKLKDALPIRGLGYDGYSYGIVPILEALGATDIKTPAEIKDEPEKIVKNIVDALFSVLDNLSADPLGFIENLIPELLYFNDVKALQAAIPNLLFSVTALLDTIQPLYEVDLYELIATLTATEENPEGFDLTLENFDLPGTLIGLLLPLAGDALGFELDDIDLEALKDRLDYKPDSFTSANGDTAYRAVLTAEGKAILLTSVLDYVMGMLENEDNVAKLKEMLAGLGLDESASEIVDQVIANLVDNYTDSVFAVFQLMYPRVVDREDAELRAIQLINWVTDPHVAATDDYWTIETPEYVAGKTPWTQEKGEFMANHMPDVVKNVLALISESGDPADAVSGLLSAVFTAENANAIAAALANLLGGIELPEAINGLIDLKALGLDASNWEGVTFEFDDGDQTAFKNALIDIIKPLTPVLSFLLAEGTLGELNDLGDPPYDGANNLEVLLKGELPIRGLGYDGYSYGIVPILEALGATGLKTAAQIKADPDNLVKNIIDPLFTVVDHLAADPLEFIDTIIPELLYVDEVKVLQAAIPNLLFSVTVLLDTLQPLYEVDLYELVAQLTATEENPAGFDLKLTDFNLTETLLDLVVNLAGDKLGLDLDEIDLNELLTRISYTPTAFTSVNGDTAYRAVLDNESKAVLLTSAMDYLIRQLGKETNEQVIKELLSGLGLDENIMAIVDEVYGNLIANYTDSVFALFQLMYPRIVDRKEAELREIQVIDWITEGNIGADEEYIGTELPEGETSLWTTEKAVYMAEHLGDFLNDVAVIFGEQLGGAQTVDEAVSYLVKDIFTAENAKAIANALANLVNNLGLPDVVKDLGVLDQLGLNPTYWENLNFSFANGDRTAFKNAMITILKPLQPVLAFLLADATLSPVDTLGDPPYGELGNLEVKLKDALPIRGLGYDGYSYGIVPLLEALGASGVKTTAAFKADKAHVVENIVNPLFTVVDHLIQNPVKFLEDILPAILYFDKVGGLQTAVENILFSVNVLIETVQPLYEIDLYELVEEKTGIDLTFSDDSPVDFILEKVTEVLKEKTDITLNLGTAEELTEELHFTTPQKFTSANGDDAYTVRLTAEGKADLLSRVLDYGVNQVIFEDNFEKLSSILQSLITDDDTRAMALGLLRIMKDADKDIADYHGIHDVALASLFWVFFGADSVTDAVSDFFYRFKDSNWYEIIFMISENAPEYVERAGFLLKEVYTVEYPAFQKILEERQALLKPPYEYTEEETQEAAGIGARIIRFFALIIYFFRNLFKR